MIQPWVVATVLTTVGAATVAATVSCRQARRDRPAGAGVGIAAWACVGWLLTLAALGLAGPALLVLLAGLPGCGLAGLIVRDRRHLEGHAQPARAHAAGIPEAQVAHA